MTIDYNRVIGPGRHGPVLTPEQRDMRDLLRLWRALTPAERKAAKRRAKKIGRLFEDAPKRNETGPIQIDACGAATDPWI